MERKVDAAHRVMCYIARAVDNPACAAAMEAHWEELKALVIDDAGEDLLHTTYLRMTTRYREGDDFVKMFKLVYFDTRRELTKLKMKHGIYPEEEEKA
jgi:hypothetical protein